MHVMYRLLLCGMSYKTQRLPWVLMMKKYLTNYNYRVIDALLLLKDNIQQRFQDIDPCFICYSIIHSSTKNFPNMKCKTCDKKLHGSCIQK